MNTGQLQPVAGEPLVDLVGPRGKEILAGRLRLTRAGLADDRQPAELIIGGNGPVPGDALGFRRGQLLAHRVPGQAGAGRDPEVSFPSLPAPDDFLCVHSGNLPARHRHPSISEVQQWSPLRLPGWVIDPVNQGPMSLSIFRFTGPKILAIHTRQWRCWLASYTRRE